MAKEQEQENAQSLVTIPAEQLLALTQRLERLERGGVAKVKRVTDRSAEMRMLAGQMVLRWVPNEMYGSATWVEDQGLPTERMMLRLETQDKDGKKSIQDTKYLDFLNNAPRVKVAILEQKANEIIEDQGMWNRVDPKTDQMGSQAVNLEVRTVEYTSTVEVQEGAFKGKKFEVPNKYLNM